MALNAAPSIVLLLDVLRKFVEGLPEFEAAGGMARHCLDFTV